MYFYTDITPEELEKHAEKLGLGGEFPVDLNEFLKLIGKGKRRLLEVGCGTGRLGVKLLPMFDYVGIDKHTPYLNVFKEKLKKKNIKFAEAQISARDFLDLKNEKFDVILFPWTVIADFSKTKQASVIEKTREMLAPGGLAILDNPANDVQYNTAPGYEPEKFFFDDWCDDFKNIGFTDSKKINYTTPTGREREITVLRVD